MDRSCDRRLTGKRVVFTRELFSEDQWTPERVAEFVNERRNATVASVGAGGQPHAGRHRSER